LTGQSKFTFRVRQAVRRNRQEKLEFLTMTARAKTGKTTSLVVLATPFVVVGPSLGRGSSLL